MSNDTFVDGMSILILKDDERPDHVDYFFVSDVWTKDPRSNRNIVIGERRGLFRIIKKTLQAELLLSMAGDEDQRRFHRAATKVLSEFQSRNSFPDKTQFASG